MTYSYMLPLDVVRFHEIDLGWYDVLLDDGYDQWWEVMSGWDLECLLESH